MRLVIGAGGKTYTGEWIATERHEIDLLRPDTWDTFLQGQTVEAIVCEAVWEHLTMAQGLLAARVCYRYLQPGGYIRAAVPDGLHPDTGYIDWVRPGGTGAGASDHKVLYTYSTFRHVFTQAGFQVKLLEHWDENGTFQWRHWNIEDGFIERSLRFDPRNQDGKPHYTSIILDAFKV